MNDPGMGHMVTELGRVIRGDTPPHRHLRARIAFLLLSTTVLDVVATVLMYLFEYDARGSGFTTIGGALFWVSAQLTTVSSQMPNPVTPAGRVLDIVLELWAISVVATAAGSFGAFFHALHLEALAENLRPRA
jgi:hypothetical protein